MASIIYHIPEVTPQTVAQLQQTAQRVLRADQTSTRWTLEHKLFRSAPNSSAPQTEPARYHHLLNLGHAPGKTFLYITEPYNPTLGATANETADGKDSNKDGVVIVIPTSQSDGFAQLLMYKLSALWIPRFSHFVHGGTAYSWGEFTIQIGEVRTSGSQGQSRGAVICISQQVPEDEEEGETENEERIARDTNGNGETEANGVDARKEELERQFKAIREVWEKFKIQGAKETVTKTVGQSKQERDFAMVRAWGDLLKFRG